MDEFVRGCAPIDSVEIEPVEIKSTIVCMENGPVPRNLLGSFEMIKILVLP
jgi:hypothetical protein